MTAALYMGTTSGVQAVSRLYLGTTSGNQLVVRAYIGTPSGNQLFYSGAPSASVSPTSVTTTSGAAVHVFSGAGEVPTVTASGGSGSYSYNWSVSNQTGDRTWTINSGGTTANAMYAQAAGSIDHGGNSTALYTCTVTDTVSGLTTTVSLTYTYNES